MDNKKLVRVLVIGGVGVLTAFIIMRLVIRNTGDRITDMPTVGQLQYTPSKIKEQSKIEQFEEQKNENQRHAMGYTDDKARYVIPNLKNLSESKKESAPPPQSGGVFAIPSRAAIPKSAPQPENPSSLPTTPKRSYHSDYFDGKAEASNPTQNPSEQAVSKNPFGTISNEVKEEKQVSFQEGSYTAEIYGDQKIEDGGIVLFRNTTEMQYLNITIPRNSIFYGQASFRGNRVYVSVNRAKTPKGEFSVAFGVRDNDKIEGLYYKAPIDETVDKTKENVNVPGLPIPGAYGQVINSAAQAAVRGGKELMKRSSSLRLEEGYKVYLISK